MNRKAEALEVIRNMTNDLIGKTDNIVLADILRIFNEFDIEQVVTVEGEFLEFSSNEVAYSNIHWDLESNNLEKQGIEVLEYIIETIEG